MLKIGQTVKYGHVKNRPLSGGLYEIHKILGNGYYMITWLICSFKKVHISELTNPWGERIDSK